MGYFLLDARITDLELWGSDWLLGFGVMSFLFTVFAVGGFSHALNIVDGFNGLSAIAAWIMLAALTVVATVVSDTVLAEVCLVIGASILGFLVWNYPRGTIFLGDGGAYLLGFLIAELAVLLVAPQLVGLALVRAAAAFLPGVGNAVLLLSPPRTARALRRDAPTAFICTRWSTGAWCAGRSAREIPTTAAPATP